MGMNISWTDWCSLRERLWQDTLLAMAMAGCVGPIAEVCMSWCSTWRSMKSLAHFYQKSSDIDETQSTSINLVGGLNPSEKYESIGMIIPNIWENKKWQPNHQPATRGRSNHPEPGQIGQSILWISTGESLGQTWSNGPRESWGTLADVACTMRSATPWRHDIRRVQITGWFNG